MGYSARTADLKYAREEHSHTGHYRWRRLRVAAYTIHLLPTAKPRVAGNDCSPVHCSEG